MCRLTWELLSSGLNLGCLKSSCDSICSSFSGKSATKVVIFKWMQGCLGKSSNNTWEEFLIFSVIVLIIIFLIRLQIPNLGINEKYQKILQNYGYDIEAVCKLYSKQKQDPPLARNLPPIAGKILWARHLFHRIQQPMDSFQQQPAVLQTPDGKRIIHNYNKVARVLMEFEVIYHRGWLQQVK